MQAYMRDQLIAMAERPTKEEAVDAIEAVLRQMVSGEPSAASIVQDLAAERR
jgi:hypothetical protein